jgi:hypothetical protein
MAARRGAAGIGTTDQALVHGALPAQGRGPPTLRTLQKSVAGKLTALPDRWSYDKVAVHPWRELHGPCSWKVYVKDANTRRRSRSTTRRPDRTALTRAARPTRAALPWYTYCRPGSAIRMCGAVEMFRAGCNGGDPVAAGADHGTRRWLWYKAARVWRLVRELGRGGRARGCRARTRSAPTGPTLASPDPGDEAWSATPRRAVPRADRAPLPSFYDWYA